MDKINGSEYRNNVNPNSVGYVKILPDSTQRLEEKYDGIILFVLIILLFYMIDYILSGINPEETTTVRTPLGVIVGTYAKSYTGRKYEVYQGIPYAQPPVGLKRFEQPEPIKNWDGILYATNRSNMCIQYRPAKEVKNVQILGEEDCLYLNIYVSSHNKNQLLPVLFNIHGGGFKFSNALTNVTFIMDRDVIFVSFNYRLGISGFLSTEDRHIPGNMGLKDQSMALRWISENIGYFGGDPKRITLFGSSAGAISVHLHYLSPLSRGLFQNGISFSGSSYIQKGSRENFQKLVSILKCPSNNISKSIDCLRQIPARKITAAMRDFVIWVNSPLISFGPCIEIESEKPFIDRSPIDIINSGDSLDALWIISVVSEEGLFPGFAFINDNNDLQDLDKRWNSLAPYLLLYNLSLSIDKHNYYSTLIRNKYFGDQNFTEKNAKAMISLLGDRLHYSTARRTANLLAKRNKSPVLFMYYSYRALDSLANYYMKNPPNFCIKGVCHGDDINLMMGSSVINPTKRAEDRAVQIKLIDYLVSVASEGYPDLGKNITWQRVSPNTEMLDVLHFVNSQNIKMESRDNFGEYKFWDELDAAEK